MKNNKAIIVIPLLLCLLTRITIVSS